MPATTTTPVTRERLNGLMQAYKSTSLLRTAVELGVFDALADGPATADALAGRLGTHPRGTRILLDAMVAISLAGIDGDAYHLPPGAEQFLVSKSPQYLGDMTKVISSDWEWDALKRLPEAVRHGGTVMDEHAETAEYQYWVDFASFASAIATPTAQVMTDALEHFAAARPSLKVLDMACGHGIYGYAFAQRHRQATVTSLDWENVVPVAAGHAERLGVSDRVGFLTGDMFTEPLGGPYDVVMLTNVLHHFSEERGIELLRRAREALKPDGRLALVGFTTGDGTPAEDPAPYLFSILMLVWTAQGEVHSKAAYDRMLSASGFADPELHTVAHLPLRVLIASPAR
ncbi:class I SAM-dependent methyltransferase [Actinoplanes sp. NPDC023936]|uniref:class I SAM-dependent methyltransferase n=1 Tax=Actinoplanes sp. NPDC023936 TaxID=3154910 RepID=UPI0033DE1233